MRAGGDESGIPFMVEADGGMAALEPVPLDGGSSGGFDEAWLQELIHRHPECLPISAIEPGFGRMHGVCREMLVGSGSIDNLLMSADGNIALVETKLWRNPQARREVLAQALDYAVALFGMGFESFERAALKARGGDPKIASLHAVLGESELTETDFVDAVTRNLRRGRAVIMVVGDGIREDAESLLVGLQDFAQFHFTLALVQLSVFAEPSTGRRLVVPRTLGRTALVKRTVFELKALPAGAPLPSALDAAEGETATIASERFWEALEKSAPGARPKLEVFLSKIKPLGVSAEVGKSLEFVCETPRGDPLSLGKIWPNGRVVLTPAAETAPRALAEAYVRQVAKAFECEARPFYLNLTLYRGQEGLKLRWVEDRLDAWIEPMRDFMKAVAAHQQPGAPLTPR